MSVPLTRKLPEELKNDLFKKILVFIEEKTYEGCQGFEINDTVKVTVAAQACILLLNRPKAFYNKLTDPGRGNYNELPYGLETNHDVFPSQLDQCRTIEKMV